MAHNGIHAWLSHPPHWGQFDLNITLLPHWCTEGNRPPFNLLWKHLINTQAISGQSAASHSTLVKTFVLCFILEQLALTQACSGHRIALDALQR